MATALRRGGGEEKHAWDVWLYTNPFFLHQMKAVCRAKHLGVDKKLLKTLLPLSCQCSAHICFQGHCTPGCPCHRNGQCSENHRSKQQCFTEKISLFFWVILDPSEIVLYVICFCCYTYHHLTCRNFTSQTTLAIFSKLALTPTDFIGWTVRSTFSSLTVMTKILHFPFIYIYF